MKRWAIFAAIMVLFAAPTAVFAGDDGGSGDRSFLLGGNAQPAQDPENSANDVIKINTLAPPAFGTVSRTLNVKLDKLDNMLEAKAYFENRSCGGGSPRFQLAVDLDGDGDVEGNLHGHWPPPPFTGCPPNRWDNQDVTDELPRWEIGAGLAGAGFPTPTCPSVNPVVNALCPFITHSGYAPWPIVETLMTALFPNHLVCSGALVDDSGWMPAAAGIAYYDTISIGRATWNNHDDTAGRGFAQGCGAADHDDDDGEPGDDNHDHDDDDNDEEDSNWRSNHDDD